MPKFEVRMRETIEWTDTIESDKNSPAYIESLVKEKWLNGGYTDVDSSSSIGDFSVVQIIEQEELSSATKET